MILSITNARSSPIKLLLVEDDQIDRLAFTRCVKQAGLPYDYTLAGSLTEALNILSTQPFEIAILDYNLGDGNASDLFPILRAKNCPFVISTGSGDEETAARLMGQGAADYLIKDPERNYLQVLPATVSKALARYQAEEQLRLLSHAVQSVKDGIYIVDPEGHLLFTNDALKTLCNVKQADVVGQSIQMLGQPALTERGTAADPCEGESCAVDVEIPLHQVDGSNIPMLLSECWIQDEAQRIRVGIMRDITPLKQVESDLRHAQDYLEQMVQERTAQLQAAIVQLQQENQERLKAEEELRASRDLIQQQQAFLRSVIDSNPNLIFVKDWDGHYLLANQAMATYYDTTVETLLGKTDADFYVNNSANFVEVERFLQENRQVIASQQELFLPEERVTQADVGEQWLQWHKRPIRLPEQETDGVLGVGVNITARKQVELSLQESEQRLASLAAAAPVGIFRTDSLGNCVYVNDRWSEISGLSLQEAWGQEWTQTLHPDDRAAIATEWYQAAQENRPFKLEYRFLRKDGTITWVFGQALAEYDATGKMVGYVGTITDISDRKQAEEALQQSEARWQFALEGAGDGVWDWNVQTNVVFFSPRWKTMLGYATDEVGDRLEDWESRVHPDDRAMCYAELDKHFKGEISSYQVEHRVRCKDGDYKWILARGKIVERTPEGQPLRIIGTHTDISDRKQAEDALRASEAYQRALIQSLPDLLIRLDQNGTYREFIAPPTFRVISGVGNFIGTTVYETLPPPLAQQRMAVVHTAIHTGTIQFYEQDLSADGILQIEEVRVVPYGDNEALLLVRDISDRKQAELTLQKLVAGTAAVTGEDFFPALVRHIAEALDVCYALVTEQVGDKLHSIGFWAHGSLQPEISYFPARTPCEYALRDGEFHCESLIQTVFPEDLDLVTMQADSYLGIALKDDQGDAIGNLCILDIRPLSQAKRDAAIPILQVFAARATAELQRQRADDALHQLNQDLETRVEQRTAELQERETQLRDFFDNATDLIQRVAPDGRILFVNAAWKGTLGYDDVDLEQLSVFQVIHPDDLEHCQTAMERLFAGEPCLGLETRFLTKDGREITVEGNVNCQLQNGVPIATRGIFRDITDRKQAEETLQRTNQDLARATRLKDEFLANMSHELRTPLNAILGMTEGLQDGVFGEINSRQLKSLQTIENSGTHLLELINDILDVAKIESGQVDLEYTSVAVAPLCKSSLAFIKQQALKKRIQLEIKLPPQLPDLFVDERRIRQVLINLLNNAVKFTPEGGRITLGVSHISPEATSPLLVSVFPNGEESEVRGYLRIAVIDTGIGIAPEHINKLFQPFVQIDGALNRQNTGTGLGLALVKQIVELHGGQVGLTSEVGVGSCFTIDLPYTTSVSSAPVQEIPSQPSIGSQPSVLTEPPLILLAEDNEANISTISSYLGAKGYRILLAKTGRDAIDLAQAEHPDLILMDIQMPEIDGLEAIRQIRHDPNLVNVPIIALTALAMTGDRDRCLEAGANDYLSKPIRLKQLATTIQQLLAAQENRP